MSTLPASRLPVGEAGRFRGRLLVLAGILLFGITLRMAVTAVSPLISRIGEDITLSAATIGLLGTLPTATFAVFGFMTPYVIRWASLERLLGIFIAAAVLGQVGRALVTGTVPFMVLSVVALAGLGAGNVLLPPLVKKYFPDKIGLLTALYSTSLALGTALPPQFAVPVAGSVGWRFSIAMWAAFSLLAAVPWVSLVWGQRRRDDGGGLQEPGGPAGSAADASTASGEGSADERSTAEGSAIKGRGAEEADVARAGAADPDTGTTGTTGSTASGSEARMRINLWKSPLALGLTFMFGCTSLQTYAMFAWLPQMLTEAGLSAGQAGSMLALFGILGLPLSLLVPIIAARMRNPFPVVMIFLSCFVAGYTGLLLVPEQTTWLWVVLVGLGPGTFPMALVMINLRTRTHVGAGALSGFGQGVGYALACSGPLLFGILEAATGSWLASFAFLGGTLVLLGIGSFIACRPAMLEDGPGVSWR
ncbi:MFS transporter [Arthrobacter castelli]|uniref:MFS transporter n=1 Tax=Arthrobacter castelli TaxID=271431 RepID=UPI0012DC95D2|nr:MFS transporter [Arthrobacter castelli]